MLLEINNLQVNYFSARGKTPAVCGASLAIKKGEVLGLVGESACGKSTLALSIANLISPHEGKIAEGEIIFNNRNLIGLPEKELRALRGREISYIFQDPSSALNPVYTIGEQITEVLLGHENISKESAKEKAIQALKSAQLADAERVFSCYPHQLSGGMKQRSMIAMAIILKPKLLIADEPTTALDVTVQAKIIELLIKLKNELGLSILFITHDLNLVSTIASRIAVMEKGKIIRYETKGLSKPAAAEKRKTETQSKENVLEAKNLKKYFAVETGFFRREKGIVKAVDGVDISLKYGQTLGIVGETGSGKTTLAKLLAGLYTPTEGKIYYEGNKKIIRKDFQMVFQHPFDSLNPRMKIEDILKEGLLIHKIAEPSNIKQRLCDLLDMVQMPKDSLDRFPHEFSGGQRQRIAIARAISVEPKVIICDEPVSSLDVSIQGKILQLLLELQERLNLSYVFISHDILIVKAISTTIAVMYQGKIIEQGEASQIFEHPAQEYTKELMSAARY